MSLQVLLVRDRIVLRFVDQRRLPPDEFARSSRNVDQPDHIPAHPVMSQQAERWTGPGEIWLAVTKYDGVQVDPILIDQAKCRQTVRHRRASNFDFPVALGLQLTNSALEIVPNQPGVGADRLQR